MTTSDISKYAKGMRLRCVCTQSSGWLTPGKEYVSRGLQGGHVLIAHDRGDEGGFHTFRFVPVEDEAPVCICGPQHNNGTNLRCPEHGRRCANPDCDELCAGVDEWTRRDLNGLERHYCNRQHMLAHGTVVRGIDPASDAPPEVKEACERFNIANCADPYAEHRAGLVARLVRDGHIVDPNPDLAVAAVMATEDTTVDLWKPKTRTHRERLVAGLRREHVKASDVSGLLHPLAHWSGRNPGRRAR